MRGAGNDVYVHVPLGTLISERVDSEDDYMNYYDYDSEIDADEFYGEESESNLNVAADSEESGEEDLEHEETNDEKSINSTRPVSNARVVTVSEIIEAQVASQQGRVLDDSVDEYSAKKLFKKRKKSKKDKRRARREEEAENQLDEEAGYEDEAVIIDMDIPGVPIRLAEGGAFTLCYMMYIVLTVNLPIGRPGVGNKAFSGTGTSRARSLPKTKLPGRQGDKRYLLGNVLRTDGLIVIQFTGL